MSHCFRLHAKERILLLADPLAAWLKALTLVPAYPLSTNDFRSEVMLPVKGLFTGRSPYFISNVGWYLFKFRSRRK